MKVLNELSTKIMKKLLGRTPVFLFKKYRIEPGSNITLYQNPNTLKIDHMNSTGTMIHNLAIEDKTIGEIIADLQRKYPEKHRPPRDVLIRDVFLFCRSMERTGLMKWKTEPLS